MTNSGRHATVTRSPSDRATAPAGHQAGVAVQAPARGAPASILALQRKIGNGATSQLIQHLRPPPAAAVVAHAEDANAHAVGRRHVPREGTGADSAGSIPRWAASPLSGAAAPLLRPSGKGTELALALRAKAEREFVHDFSRVQIHDDAETQAALTRLDADAASAGSRIFIGPSRPAPGTPAEHRLLWHELAHVVQQTGPPHPAAALLSAPGSAQERIADEVADGQPASTIRPIPGLPLIHRQGRHKAQIRARTSPSVVQRCGDHACPPAGCGSREPQDRLFRSASGVPAPGLDSAWSMAQAPGRPLPGPLAQTMGLRLGHDFSHVRVHNDAQAAASAAYYAADAYTFGSHIIFGADQYQPGSESGQRLLLHELTHVVQASSGGGTATGISSPSDASEREASRAAATGGTSHHAGAGAVPSAAIQRQARPGAQKAAMPGSDTPAEKWSQTLEAAYRAQGDFRRAAAIRSCRERGGRSCDLVLTQREVRALYNAAQEAKGDEKRVRAEVSHVVPGQLGPLSGLPVTATPVLGLLGPAPVTNVPVPPVPGVPPPTVPLGGAAAGAGEVGVAVGTGEAGAAAATGISTGAVAATGALAIVAICVIAGIQLWQFGRFQAELESRGFIILDDALAVCIKGCHTSPVRLPTFREFPDVPTFPQPETRLQPWGEEAKQRWREQFPEPTRGTEEQPRPAPRKPREREGNCQTSHPYWIPCVEELPIEEQVIDWIGIQGYSYQSLGDCWGMGTVESIEACNGAPGESWHCKVKPEFDPVSKVSRPGGEVSVFKCLCCYPDGASGYEWVPHHWGGRSR